MEANELRIGNVVKQGDIIRLQEYAARVKYNDSTGNEKVSYVDYDRLDPIPLTEEWLWKLAFEDIPPTGMSMDTSLKTFSFNKGNFQIIKVYGGFNLYYIAGMFCNLKQNIATTFSIIPHGNIKYVHQLQNLYFALTGEELIPKKRPNN